MEEKIKVELPFILPCTKEKEDQCIDRLLEILKLRRGIGDALIEQMNGARFLCVAYDPDFFTPSHIQKVIELAGATVKNRYRHEILKVDSMDCLTCADVLEHSLSRLDGVLAVSVNYGAERIRIDYDGAKIGRKQIDERIRHLGYKVTAEETVKPWHKKHRELILSILCGIFLLSGSVVQWLIQHQMISLCFFIAAYGTGGYHAFRDSLKTLLKRRFDIEFLMLIAAIGAAIIGSWQEGALLLFLFSLGHGMEHLAMNKARENISALGKMTPKSAIVHRNGRETEISVNELLRGDIVIVKPGERIPADGKVSEGHSFVDQSPITGESIPVEKNIGDDLFAGTINGNGLLRLSVTKLAKESTLYRVLQMIEEASAQKSTSQRFSEKFERLFVPAILLVILAAMLIFTLTGKALQDSIYKILALLVASSPCALAIATPSAVLAGIARAAKEGVLIKGGIHLENLGKVIALAFDKTGTITSGKPRIVEIRPEAPYTEEDLLKTAASCESVSEHPLAKAILEAATARKLELLPVERAEQEAGRGIFSCIGGEEVVIGKPSLFAGLPPKISDDIVSGEEKGYTIIVIKKGDRYLGTLALQDTPRESARRAIDELKRLKIRSTIMITGDNERSARGIGNMVGIDEVSADLLPEDKVRVISEYAKRYEYVAMVGDGINDAPAMAKSTLSIAMGSAGSDVALETADVALMADNLLKIPFVIALGRNVSKVIRQNLMIALGVIAILVLSVLSGWVGISLAVIAHEGSTLLVVLNALGILGFRDRFSEPG